MGNKGRAPVGCEMWGPTEGDVALPRTIYENCDDGRFCSTGAFQIGGIAALDNLKPVEDIVKYYMENARLVREVPQHAVARGIRAVALRVNAASSA